MDPELRSEVSGRLEKISLNPFENDLNAEANIAHEQYQGAASLLRKIRTGWLRRSNATAAPK